MARRAVVAGAALVTALAGTIVPGADAAMWADTCDAALPMAGTIAGAVGNGNNEDWFRHPVAPGRYLVTLESTIGDADLSVGDGSCSGLCGSATPILLERCDVRATDPWLTIGAWSASRLVPASYVVTVTPLADVTACTDRIDNDGDGAIDIPADDGCAGPQDTSEDTSPCNTTAGVEVCTTVTPGAVLVPVVVEQLESKEYMVEGGLDLYEFRVLGADVPVTCVVLSARPVVAANPCRTAGGRFKKRLHPLYYRHGHDVPRTPTYPRSLVNVCEATLTITVDSVTTPSPIPMLTTC